MEAPPLILQILADTWKGAARCASPLFLYRFTTETISLADHNEKESADGAGTELPQKTESGSGILADNPIFGWPFQ